MSLTVGSGKERGPQDRERRGGGGARWMGEVWVEIRVREVLVFRGEGRLPGRASGNLLFFFFFFSFLLFLKTSFLLFYGSEEEVLRYVGISGLWSPVNP